MHKRAYSESVATSKQSLRKKNEIKENNEFKEKENIEKGEKKLENVVVRIRKLDKNEKSTLHTDPNDKTTLYFDKDFEIEKYNFDIVFDENDDNKTIFNSIGGHYIINNVCNGFKETIITYGQTGSGKTYTLFGSNKEYGIIYYFVHYLYKLHNTTTTKKKTIYLSIYEILGDTLIDLISNINEKNVEFYTEEYYLKTIKYSYKVVNIKNYEMAKKIIDTACLLRNVEATSQNMRSSRSHAIIQFFVNISESTLNNGIETTRDYYGVLTLVDLVGCEREDFNTNKSESKNDKTSSKLLNSSLTSLNKMLRKMQMGNLDESDKRQSVLCKVLFNYIQKTCGVCLIFCFNPKLSQKSLTSSTLIMASDCKKIKSKRKQLIYVKSENKENFFKKIANDDHKNDYNNNNNNNNLKDIKNNMNCEEERNDEFNYINNIGIIENEKEKNMKYYSHPNNNSPICFIFVNDDKDHVINIFKKKNDERYTILRNVIKDIMNDQIREEKKKKNVVEQLKGDIVKLKNECAYWKKETHNYHNKLKILNKNYLKINEFLFNTLNTNSINNYNSSNFYSKASKFDEEIYSQKKNKDIIKNNNHILPEEKYEYMENKEKEKFPKHIEKNLDHFFNSNQSSNSKNLLQENVCLHTNSINCDVEQINENKINVLKNNTPIKNDLSFNEKKNYKNFLHKELNNQTKISTQFYTKKFKDYEYDSLNTHYKTINSKTERAKEPNDNKIVFYNNTASSVPVELKNYNDIKNKSPSNNKIIQRESNINIHETNENDIRSKLYEKEPIFSNHEMHRTYSMKEHMSYANNNKMCMEKYNDFNLKYNKNDSGKEIIINDHHASSKEKKEQTKKSIINFISNNDYKNLSNITIDSLASKIKNRMLKSRSLSVAR